MPDLITRLTVALADRYRVERELGAGGMATVYLAEDLRHGRKVAIKVLHEDLGATLGPERFLAEIKTTARLQHPHVLTLLDSGTTAGEGKGPGLLYYVMPYVEGESLRDRLNREKQLPIDEAVQIAREIADALGAAHAQGIIHRDIKPENILLQRGHALVADFGIALAVQQAGGSRLTQTGLSLGTPQYMAPEQAMGEKSVDARADVYALGAVTYEMLVGEPPFTGATVQAIVAKVLSSEPEPPSTIRKTMPAHVEDAVLTALAKLPADRFASAAAFGTALGSPQGSGVRATAARPAHAAAGRARTLMVAGAAAGLAIGIGVGWVAWRRGGTSAQGGAAGVTRSYLLQPSDEAMPNGTADFALSPDGNDLVYVGPGEAAGTTQLWRKRRADLHATRIGGTAGGSAPFFSPDGTWVAYTSKAGLMKVSLSGGAPFTVSPDLIAALGRGAWLPDGRIVAGGRTFLGVVPADGGKVTQIAVSGQFAGYNPIMVEQVPGTSALLVQTCPPGCPRAVIYMVDMAKKVVRQIIGDGRSPTWLPSGHIAYVVQSGAVMVVKFDASALAVRGEPKPVLEHASALAASRSGDLVYREAPVGSASRAVWVDRAGRIEVIDPSWVAQITSAALSPDGRRLAVSVVADREQQLWLKDLPRGPLSKLTFGAGDHFRPAWSGDGRKVWYIKGDSAFALYEQTADGTGSPRRMNYGPHQVVDASASRNGAWIAMRTGAGDTTALLLAMRPGADSAFRSLPHGTGYKLGLALSPDARFIAYQSPVSGRPEVYVSPFPDVASARWQVSRDGATEPRWAVTGEELFFVTLNDELMATSWKASPTFAVTSTAKLFDVGDYVRDGGYHAYEPLADGRRFVMLKLETFPGQLVRVDNWFAELRDLLKGTP